MLARLRRTVANLLAGLRRERTADPAAWGFSDDDVAAMVAGASGDTVTRERLLGPAAEAPLLEHLSDGEQPHHAVPLARASVEMGGETMAADSGYLLVTDQRLLLLCYRGLTVGHNEVAYDHVESVGRTADGDEMVLTVRTAERTLRGRADADRWGGALEAALDDLLQRRSRDL